MDVMSQAQRGKGTSDLLWVINRQHNPLIHPLPKHLDILLIPGQRVPLFVNVRE